MFPWLKLEKSGDSIAANTKCGSKNERAACDYKFVHTSDAGTMEAVKTKETTLSSSPHKVTLYSRERFEEVNNPLSRRRKVQRKLDYAISATDWDTIQSDNLADEVNIM